MASEATDSIGLCRPREVIWKCPDTLPGHSAVRLDCSDALWQDGDKAADALLIADRVMHSSHSY